MLIATGFGTENTQVKDNYRGFGFWESDPLRKYALNMGIFAPQRMLISGAGDGALQDLLRVLTGPRSACEFAELGSGWQYRCLRGTPLHTHERLTICRRQPALHSERGVHLCR